MRFFKSALYILAVIVAQTVIFPRLNFFGVIPDLVLVSAVAFAVVAERTPSNIFSAVISLIQDILSTGIYINTLVKVIAANAINSVKEGFAGDEYALTAGMVALLTPIQLLAEGAILYFFWERQFSPAYFIFKLLAATIYNLMLVPLIFPLIKEINRAD
ncbi:MAG: rod shape-determining protein MreD [Candidatus Margulisbacteria bacterium]|nr:rod shape-determining protein MreD [Candidatus Margulisiibacteriota bacterium]